jgi:SAM-dependent methyltransferase
MKKEIEANRDSWNLLAKDHYAVFKQALMEHETLLNSDIIDELGDIKGKSLIHMQCNTGADTLCLKRLGASVSGVDLAPDNILYAKKLFADFKLEGQFYESDILEFTKTHHQKYDVVFTSEGAIIWLPDLKKWARTARKLIKDDGFFYVNEMHPFFLMFDESEFPNHKLILKYPYFGRKPEIGDSIGGYAAETRPGVNYSWMYSIADVVNALIEAGFQIEFIHEFDSLCYDLGGMTPIKPSHWQYPDLKGKMPFMFSIKATVRKT